MPALISLAFHPPATAHSLTTAAPRRRRRSILVFFRGSADLHKPMAQADWLRARLLATLRFKNDSDCRRGWLAPPQCQIHGLDVYISERPASTREYVREMRDMAALVLDLRALRQDVRADEMTRARDRRGAELRALIARADQGADS